MAFLPALAAPLLSQGGKLAAATIATKLAPILGDKSKVLGDMAAEKGLELATKGLGMAETMAAKGIKNMANRLFSYGKKKKSIRGLFRLGQRASKLLQDSGLNRDHIRQGIDIGGNLLGKDVSKVHEMATKAMSIQDNLGKLMKMGKAAHNQEVKKKDFESENEGIIWKLDDALYQENNVSPEEFRELPKSVIENAINEYIEMLPADFDDEFKANYKKYLIRRYL